MEPKGETRSPARQYIPLDMSILSGGLRVVHVHLRRRVADVTRPVIGGAIVVRPWPAALMDQTTPPSTVFAAFNAYAGEKDIQVWPYNGHEGGGPDDDHLMQQFLSRILRTEGSLYSRLSTA